MKIVISGTVGVGKSTITKQLKEKLSEKNDNVFLYKELQETTNPLLVEYYRNRNEWAYITQIDFLLSRFKSAIEEEVNQAEDKKRIAIFDRHFLDDYIFANMPSAKEDMSAFQLNQYFVLNEHLTEKLAKKSRADVFVLLTADFETVIERVKKRGRDEEKEVDIAYWTQLYNIYYKDPKIQKYLKDNSKKFHVINTTDKKIEEIVKEIMELL